MLTIRKIGSPQSGDYARYLTGRADGEREAWRERGDYYSGDTAAGEWMGDPDALHMIGVNVGEVVAREDFARALRGQDIIGIQLRRPGANGVVNSHDLTFGVPKSVSVLWAQGSAEQRVLIELVARDAAEQAVRYMAMTTSCVQRRVSQTERVWEPAAGVAAAMFVHHTARSTKQNAIPDPHLHVHCVIVAARRSDGVIVTPNQATWMRHGREGGAYFRAELASRLIELGLAIAPETGKGGRFFEVEGVPRELCERMSGRTREVEAQLAEFVKRYGRLPQDAELADLAIKSRERKVAHTTAELEPYWKAVCAEHGFAGKQAKRLWRNEPALDHGRAREEVERRLPELIAQQGATVRSREARAMAYELSAGRLTASEAMDVVADLQRAGRLIALADDRVTTLDIRTQERSVLEISRRLGDEHGPSINPSAKRAGIRAAERALGAPLSAEQRHAAAVLMSDARIAALTGPAGTGKGAVIRAASEALQADGRQVIAVATQGATAQRLGEQAQTRALTIDGLAFRARNGYVTLDAGSVVIVDEAATVDTYRLATLTSLSTDAGCSLRLVGDSAQLQAIGAGGLFDNVCELVPVAELAEIHRTPHEWIREAQTAIRDARAEDALTLLREHGAAHMLDTHADAMQAMVDDWNVWRRKVAPGEALLVVHTNNADVDTVNQLAQAKRIAAGELGNEAVRAPDRSYDLHVGDQVMFRRQPYTFDEPGVSRIENGTRGVVVALDEERKRVQVQLIEARGEQPRVVEIELERCAALRLDYASHVYPAQGDTRTRTAELTGGPGTSQQAAYVGATRLREQHDLYTSREALGVEGTDAERWERLAEQMNTSRRELPSINYAEQTERQIAQALPATDLNSTRERLVDVERQLDAAIEQHKALDLTRPRGVENELHLLDKQRAEAIEYADSARERLRDADARLDKLERLSSFLKKEERWQAEREARSALNALQANTRRREQADKRIAELRSGPNDPARWQREHAAEVERRAELVQELARERHSVREQVIEHTIHQPPPYMVRAIGPRPVEPQQRETWEKAARTIEQYRHDHNVADRLVALGREPSEFQPKMEFDRVRREIERTRQALDLSHAGRDIACNVTSHAPVIQHDHSRGISRGFDIGR